MTKRAKAYEFMKTAKAIEEKGNDYLELELLLRSLLGDDLDAALSPDSSLFSEISLALRGKEKAFFHYLAKKMEKLGEEAQLNLLRIAHNLISEEHVPIIYGLVLSSKTQFTFQLQLLELIKSVSPEIFQEERKALEKAKKALDCILAGTDSTAIQVLEMKSHPKHIVLKIIPILARHGHQAIPLFQSLLAQSPDDPECTIAIIRALGNMGHADSVSLLKGILESTTSRTIIKAIKKALYLQKTKGLEVEKRIPAIATIPKPRFQIVQAWATHIDPFGRRVIFCIRTKPFGGFYLVYLVLKELPGIEKSWTIEVEKKEFQSFYDRFVRDEPCVPITPEHFLFLFHEALQRMISLNQAISYELSDVKEILGSPDLSRFQPPVYDIINKDKVACESWLFDRSAKLLEQEECAGWQFQEEDIREYYDEIRLLDDRRIIVSPHYKQIETNEIYSRALQNLIDPPMQNILKRRLEETAFLFVKNNRMLEAKMAVAAAIGLEKGQVSTHPLLTQMLKSGLKVIEEKEKEEKNPERG